MRLARHIRRWFGPHWKYLKYLLRHKWFVLAASVKLRVSLWRMLKHDWHKFLPGEWSPYVAYFYGPTVALKDSEPDDYRYWCARGPVEAAFNRAWNLHQKRADHHWQFWVLLKDDGSTVVLEMPEAAIREMVADWYGAGRAITGKWEAPKWFLKNHERMKLAPNTAARVAELLHQSERARLFKPWNGIYETL